ncbi:MAG: hypothetical protein H0T15_00600 [Thermoleophilaceae bacterium]|nr:hypothetical protein [Thermoleophilaceae bacterium]
MSEAKQSGNGQALEEVLRERNELWSRLNEERFDRAELESLRARVAMMEGSLTWRLGKPLRDGKAFVRDAGGALERRRKKRS